VVDRPRIGGIVGSAQQSRRLALCPRNNRDSRGNHGYDLGSNGEHVTTRSRWCGARCDLRCSARALATSTCEGRGNMSDSPHRSHSPRPSPTHRDAPQKASAVAASEVVGISGLALYLPRWRVDLKSWCDWNGASWPKISSVIGHSFRVPGPDENVYTMAAAAVLRLILQYEIDPTQVGFLGFGTESSTDNAA